MTSEHVNDSVQIIESEDQILDFTQTIRKQIITSVMKEGKIPDADTKDMFVLQQTLDGLDRAALGRKKIKVEENVGNNQAAAAAVIANLLTQVQTVKPFEVTPLGERPVPMLGTEFSPPTLVDGEIAVSPPQQSYEAFQAKFAPSNEQSDGQQ